MGTMRDPKWWSEEHRSAWERAKAAFRRDWEQTKADFSKTKGQELDQNAADTVKQAVGADPVPPAGVPTPEDWDEVEEGLRYGYGAGRQYAADHADWDEGVETRLQKEWSALGTGRTWDAMRPSVRRGWERSRDYGNR